MPWPGRCGGRAGVGLRTARRAGVRAHLAAPGPGRGRPGAVAPAAPLERSGAGLPGPVGMYASFVVVTTAACALVGGVLWLWRGAEPTPAGGGSWPVEAPAGGGPRR